MKRTGHWIFLAAGLAGASLPAAHATNTPCDNLFTDAANMYSGFVGYHLISINPDPNYQPFGISFDLGTTSSYTPQYELGVERGNTDFLLSSHVGTSVYNQFRLRMDTGQIETGTQIGHPGSTNQLNVIAGRDSSPVVALDGVGISINGNQTNLNLTQRSVNTASKRTSITFGFPTSGYQIGTDSLGTGATYDWYIKDLSNSRLPLTVAPGSDVVTLGYGATVTGTLTAQGTLLTAQAGSVGFFGATAVGQQTVTGCRSDGTALKSLITALANLGLVKDQTTP